MLVSANVTFVRERGLRSAPMVVVEDMDPASSSITVRGLCSPPAWPTGAVIPMCDGGTVTRLRRGTLKPSMCGAHVGVGPGDGVCRGGGGMGVLAGHLAAVRRFSLRGVCAAVGRTLDAGASAVHLSHRHAQWHPARGAANVAASRRRQPGQPWATMVLGYATHDQDERRALALYESPRPASPALATPRAKSSPATTSATSIIDAATRPPRPGGRAGDRDGGGIGTTAADGAGCRPRSESRDPDRRRCRARVSDAPARAPLAFPPVQSACAALSSSTSPTPALPRPPGRYGRRARTAPRPPEGGRIDSRRRDGGVQPAQCAPDAERAAADRSGTRAGDGRGDGRPRRGAAAPASGRWSRIPIACWPT